MKKLDVVRTCDPFTLNVECVDPRVFMNKVYLGLNATMTLMECRDPEAAVKMRQVCLSFLIELVEQIRYRFRIDEPVCETV